MTLHQYLSDTDQTNAQFAQVVGVSEATISRLRRNRQTPSFGLLRRIASATNGTVTADDFTPTVEAAE